MLNMQLHSENFPSDFLSVKNEPTINQTMKQQQPLHLACLSKLPDSKSIKKEKLVPKIRDSKAVVCIRKDKQNQKKLLLNQAINKSDQLKNYLRNQKIEQTQLNLKAKYLGVMSQISPQEMDNFQSYNFQSEMERTKAIASTHLFMQDEDSFENSNDITTPYFNPVIHTIENYMSKKENKKANTDATKNQQRLSFLSIRNIWAGNSGLNLRGQGVVPSEQQQAQPRTEANNQISQNSLITQDMHENNDQRSQRITGYTSPNMQEDMQNIRAQAQLDTQRMIPHEDSQSNVRASLASSNYNSNQDSSRLAIQNQEQYLSSSPQIQQ